VELDNRAFSWIPFISSSFPCHHSHSILSRRGMWPILPTAAGHTRWSGRPIVGMRNGSIIDLIRRRFFYQVHRLLRQQIQFQMNLLSLPGHATNQLTVATRPRSLWPWQSQSVSANRLPRLQWQAQIVSSHRKSAGAVVYSQANAVHTNPF
jgi:hypothetical protein